MSNAFVTLSYNTFSQTFLIFLVSVKDVYFCGPAPVPPFFWQNEKTICFRENIFYVCVSWSSAVELRTLGELAQLIHSANLFFGTNNVLDVEDAGLE